MPQTYIVNIKDLDKTWKNFEKRTRYEIRKCDKEVEMSEDVDRFNEMHKETRPDRKIDKEYIEGVIDNWLCFLLETDTAMALFGIKGKMGYYLLAARKKGSNDGSPSKILWEAMKMLNISGCDKLEMCGANKENIKLFKRGFGGKLVEQKEYCLKY